MEIETTDHNSCAPAENVLDGTHERPQVVHSTPDSHLFIHQIAKAKVPKCQWIKIWDKPRVLFTKVLFGEYPKSSKYIKIIHPKSKSLKPVQIR